MSEINSNAKDASVDFMKRALPGDQYGLSLQYRGLIFSTNASVGHLPAYALIGQANLNGVSALIPRLSQRVAFCVSQSSIASLQSNEP